MAKPKRAPAEVALDVALEIATRKAMPDGRCAVCMTEVDPAASTSRFTTLFCSLSCEHRFIREGLRSLTVEDCTRIQQRAEELLRGLRANEPQA